MLKKHKLIKLLEQQTKLAKQRHAPLRVEVSIEEKLKLDIINLERRLDALTEACAVLANWVIMAEGEQVMTIDKDGSVNFKRLRL